MKSDAAPETPHHLQWSGLTDPGRFRKNNEDAFLALNFDAFEVRYLGKDGTGSLATNDYVFAVSDGMGGAEAGEVASKIAVEKITRLLPQHFQLGAHRIDPGDSDHLGEVFVQTHQALLDLGRVYEECAGMGATLSLCWFMPGWMAFGHVGDSRIYYLPEDGPMKQLSHDHSHVGSLQRAGAINEREARNHPKKNILSQVLGGKSAQVSPQIGRVDCLPGDRFLICSDGLIDGLWDRRINDMAREKLSAKTLVDYAVAESGRDNTTALLIEIQETRSSLGPH
ncbi:MAG: PP2C family protein-serine/threonine phosphatase [Verrucomicrobiales bacterium]